MHNKLLNRDIIGLFGNENIPQKRLSMSETEKIDKLTESQIARFGEFVDRWTQIGLCTEPADRYRAEKAIHLSYKIGGQRPPEKIIWLGSPLGNGLARHILKEINGASVRDSVGDSVRASVWA